MQCDVTPYEYPEIFLDVHCFYIFICKVVIPCKPHHTAFRHVKTKFPFDRPFAKRVDITLERLLFNV